MRNISRIMNSKTKPMDTQTIIILLLIGLAAGMLGGMVGIGGGIVIVPALVYFMAFSQKTAQGTSLALLLLPVGILGFLQYYRAGHINLKATAVIAVAFIAGSYFGSKMALSLSQDMLKKIFALLLIAVAVKMLFFDKPSPTDRAAQNDIAEKI